jgi:hypothetical protein
LLPVFAEQSHPILQAAIEHAPVHHATKRSTRRKLIGRARSKREVEIHGAGQFVATEWQLELAAADLHGAR